MKKTVSVGCMLAACLLSTAIEAREVTFSVGQTNPDWAFLVSGEGHATVGRSAVYATLDSLTITNNPIHGRAKTLESVTVEFGFRASPNGGWNAETGVGGTFAANLRLEPGQSVTFENLDAAHSIIESIPEQYWIVVTVDMPNGAKVHAHSARDVLR